MTGHTGFKGAWLSLWLQQLEARVTGLSLGVPSQPSLYALARAYEGIESIDADVRDPAALTAAVEESAPEVVIHMAAQPLVRRSYEAPAETFEINVTGTLNVLEAVRQARAPVRAVVVVTSDKCYENRDPQRPRREDDPLGGHDPYSSSKACAELLTAAYRGSFFGDPAAPRIATARAGNVIGGGDWARDRLVPDAMRAASTSGRVHVRNPEAVRPWQHVLNPLSGYLLLAESLCADPSFADAWNFGPPAHDAQPVRWVLERLAEHWPGGIEWTHDDGPHPHEAPALRLDSTRAAERLDWRPAVALEPALAGTVAWFRALEQGEDMRAVTLAQLDDLRSPSLA